MSEISIESAVDRLSRVLIDDTRVTPRDLPLRSIPSSINSFIFIKTVSGKSDHKPGDVI